MADGTLAGTISKMFGNRKLVGVADYPCPICGGPMYCFKGSKMYQDGHPKYACPNPDCKYKEGSDDKIVRSVLTPEQLTMSSVRSDAIRYMKHNSVISNTGMWSKRFSDFIASNEVEQNVYNKSQAFVKQIVAGGTNHMIMSGETGVGKSHLAMSILWEYLRQTNYGKRVTRTDSAGRKYSSPTARHVLYCNFRDLLELLKQGINDKATGSMMTQVLNELKVAELVVIDDLGAELANRDVASPYAMDQALSIFEARQHKPTVITTNLHKNEIVNAYDARIWSRLTENSRGFILTFKGINDHRQMEGV